MKGFDVLKVKSAVKNHNKFDLSRTHLTTMNFGEIVPLLAEETVPGDKFSIGAEYFSRMAPLVKPTYGKFSFKTVAAFVPYYMIAEDCDAWMAGRTTWEGSTPVQRCITVGDLHNFISYYCTSNGTAVNTQYTYVNSNGNVQYCVFSNKGRYWVKILNSLGYALPENVDLQTTSTWYAGVKDSKLSAYPLLAFFKLYNDYMSQSQRFNTSVLSSLLQNIKYNKTVASKYTATTGILTYAGMKDMFDNLFLNYENGYFTSAWQSPNTALYSSEGITQVQVPSNVNGLGRLLWTNDDNELQQAVNPGSPSTVAIGQRALDFLQSFDNWVRRNNYSGSRAVQQIYSRFGIKTDDYKSHYAKVISTDTLPVQVGDVTATADATNVPLGDYAGKGIMAGKKGISCDVSDYGIILILGYFTVVPMMSFGYDRKVLRTNPLDFYNPEFDGLGAEAISVSEVYENCTQDPTADTTSMLDVYGFTERYNSYRYGRDQITGEFRDYNPTGSMNTWHTGRNLNTIRNAGNCVAQSTSMNTLPQYDSEYNRIFSITSGDVDHFYMTAKFDVSAIRPMLNLNQVPRLGEGDTTVPRNGNVIS